MENNVLKGGFIRHTKNGLITKVKNKIGRIIIVSAKTMKELMQCAQAAANTTTAVILFVIMASSCATVQNVETVCEFSDGTMSDTIRYTVKTRAFNHGDTLHEFRHGAEFRTFKIR